MRLSRFQRRARCVSLAALLCLVSVFATAQQQSPQAEGAAPDSSPNYAAAQVAKRLLSQIQNGLEARNSRQIMAAFDRERMPGYLAFQDQVEAFVAQNGSFSVYLGVESASLEKDSGSAVVQAMIELTPVNGPSERREARLSFEFGKTERGWRIVDFEPRSFFS